MRKKVLLTLLAASPVAFTAYADVDLGTVNTSDWGVDGVAGQGLTIENGKVTIPLAATNAKVTFKVDKTTFPIGTYAISFGTQENVAVTVAGQKLTLEKDGTWSAQFTLSAATTSFDITVERAEDQKDVVFSDVAIKLVFDFQAYQTKINDLCAALKSDGITASANTSATAKSLATEVTTFNKKVDDFVTKSVTPIYPDGQTIKFYTDNELNKADFLTEDTQDQSVIYKAYLELKAEADALQAKVDAENDRYQTQVDNLATEKDLQAAAKTDLTDRLTKIQKAIAAADAAEKGNASTTYVTTTTKADVTSITAAIKAYTTKIDNTYGTAKNPVDTAVSEETATALAEEKAGIVETLDALEALVTEATNDQKAYNLWAKKVDELDKAKADAEAAYDEYQSPLYDDVVTASEDAIQGIYDEAKAALLIKKGTVKGAKAGWEPYDDPEDETNSYDGDEATLTAAIAAINAEFNAVNDARDTQEANKATADELIDGYQNTLADLRSQYKGGAEDTVKDLNDQATKILDKINSLTEIVDSEYNKHDLFEDDYADLKAEIDSLLETLSTAVDQAAPEKAIYEANSGKINDLQEQLDAIKEALKKTSDENKTKYGVDVYSKFETTFGNIQEAIEALNANNRADLNNHDIDELTEDELAPTQNSITLTKTNVDNIIAALDGITEYLDACNADLASFKKFIDSEKQIVADAVTATTKSGKTTYAKYTKPETKTSTTKGLYGTVQVAYNKLVTDFQTAAKTENPNELYNALVDYKSTTIDSSTVQADIATNRDKFGAEATTANYNAAKKLYDEVSAALELTNEETSYADNKAALDKLNTEVIVIEEGDEENVTTSTSLSGIGTAVAGVYDEETFNKYDADVPYIIAALKAFQSTELKAAQDNQAAYKAISDMIDKAQKAIDDAAAYTDANAKDPAKSYYKNTLINTVADDEYTTLQETLNALKAEIEQGHDDGNSVSLKDEQIAALQQIIDDAAAAEQTVQANENAYAEQQTIDNGVTEYLEKVKNIFANSEEVSDENQKELADIEAALKELRLETFESYGKGESVKEDANYKKQYEDLQARLEALLNGYLDTYQKLVSDANDEWIKTTKWEDDETVDPDHNIHLDGTETHATVTWADLLARVKNVYSYSVDTYDNYRYSLTNEGLKEAIGDVITDHSIIYQYANYIYQLEAALAQYKIDLVVAYDEDGNVDPTASKLLSKEATEQAYFKANFIDKAYTYIVQMNSIIEEMVTQAEEIAKTYWESQEARVKNDVIGAAKTQMEEATVSDDLITAALKDANTTLAKAQMLVALFDDTYLMPNLSDILNELDKLTLESLKPNIEAAAKAEYDNYAELILNGKNEVSHEDEEGNKVVDEAEVLGLQDYMDKINGLSKTNIDKDVLAAVITEAFNIINGNSEDPENDPYFEDAKTAANTQANDGNLIDNLKEDKAVLDAILEKVKKLYEDTLSTATAADEYNTYITEVLPGIDAGIADLETYVDGLAVEELIKSLYIDSEKDAKAAIDATVAELGDKGGAEYYTSAAGAIVDDLNAGFVRAYSEELDAIKKLISKLEVAFNRVQKDGWDSTPSWEETKNIIEGYIADWQAYRNELSSTVADDVTYVKEQRDSLKELQDKVADLTVTLDNMVEGKVVGDVQNTINGNADLADVTLEDVQKAITAAQSDLDAAKAILANVTLEGYDSVSEDYQAAYDALVAELDAVKAGTEAGGANILVQEANYLARINAVVADAEALKAAVEAAQVKAQELIAKKAVNDAKIAEFNAQFDEIYSLLDEMEALDASYDCVQFSDGLIQGIRETIQECQNEYQAEADQLALTAESTNSYASYAQTIKAYIGNLNNAEIYYHYNKDVSALTTVNATLQSGNYLDAEGLQESVYKLNDRLIAVRATLTAQDENGNNTFSYAYENTKEGVAEVIAELNAIGDEIAALQLTVTEAEYVFGDLDDNKVVDAFDFQTLLGYILNDTQKDSTNKSSVAADANNDGNINVADLAAVFKLMNGGSASNVRMQMRSARQEGANVISIDAVSQENGVTRYAINLNNAATFVAGQFDITLPAGMSVVSESVADRASDLNLVSNDLSDGRHRVVIIGNDLQAIDGNNGAVVYIDVTGSGKLDVQNAQFTDSNAVSYDVASQGATGIDAIYESIQSVGQKIYDASGRLMNRIQRGINIIRRSDGTTTKEFHNSDK